MNVDRRRKAPSFKQIRAARELAIRENEDADRIDSKEALLVLSDALALAELELQKARTDSDYWRQFNENGMVSFKDAGSNKAQKHKAQLEQISYLMRTYFQYDVTSVFPEVVDEAAAHIEALLDAGKTLAYIIRSEEFPLTRKTKIALELFEDTDNDNY